MPRPHVQQQHLGEADHQKKESRQPETALVDGEREDQNRQSFDAPGDRDHAGAHLEGEHEGQQERRARRT